MILSAQGTPFTQASEPPSLRCIVLLCGRYEGVDGGCDSGDGASIGDYALSGGECRRWW